MSGNDAYLSLWNETIAIIYANLPIIEIGRLYIYVQPSQTDITATLPCDINIALRF